MLVSHRHRFIYLKTFKTAGTSLEFFLDRYCVPPGELREPARLRALRSAGPVMTPDGIVGMSGRCAPGCAWCEHTPAATARQHLGDAIWASYRKLCAVRHPLDREVSWFWHKLPKPEAEQLAAAPMAAVRARFLERLQEMPVPSNRPIYCIDDRFALDEVLRYERLAEDLAAFCGRLGEPVDLNALPRMKHGFRRRPEPWEDYYDTHSRARALAEHAHECQLFGYG